MVGFSESPVIARALLPRRWWRLLLFWGIPHSDHHVISRADSDSSTSITSLSCAINWHLLHFLTHCKNARLIKNSAASSCREAALHPSLSTSRLGMVASTPRSSGEYPCHFRVIEASIEDATILTSSRM